MDNEPNNTEKVQKSSRVMAWSKFLRAVSLLIWSVIGFIILGYGGYYFFLKDTGTSGHSPVARTAPREARVPPIYSNLDKAVAQALEEARSEARSYALGQLDQWENELRHRVDTDFLPWYFGYWGSQIRGAKALFDGLKHWVDSDQPTAQEKMTEEFQREFTIRVLQPKTSQLQLERIQREALVKFLSHFKRALNEIPKKYNVSAPEWEKYVSDVSQQSSLIESSRQVPITLKTIYAASVGGGVAIAAKVLSSFKGGISSGVATKLAGKMGGKVGAKIAAKTGGKVAGKLGGEFLGPIIGVGIIAWDLWDHYTTVKENKPLLRENLFAFLDEMKLAILDDPGTGVMSPVYQVEDQVKNSLAVSQKREGTPRNPIASETK